MNTLKKVGAAIKSALSGVDPKVLSTIATTAVTYLVAHVGLNVDDPTILIGISAVASAIVGVLVPNAGSGLADRWTPAAQQSVAAVAGPASEEPDAIPI